VDADERKQPVVAAARVLLHAHLADPVDENTVYALNTGTYKSTDGGKTFPTVPISQHSDNHDLWINPINNKTLIESNDGGASVTVNGGPLSPIENQMTAEIYRIETDTRWPYWVYGSQQDNSSIACPARTSATPTPSARRAATCSRSAQSESHLRGQLRRVRQPHGSWPAQ
jgi:hypothetical protein